MFPVASLMEDNYRPMEHEHIAALARKLEREGFRVEHGVPLIRPAASGSWLGDRYWIVSGHHRIAAARLLGWETIPCVLLDVGEVEGLVRSVEANSARRDAPVVDEAEAFGRLAASGLTAEAIAEQIGRTPGYVDRRLQLLALDPAVRHIAGRYGFRWAELLVHLAPQYQRQAVRALEDGPISLVQYEQVVKRIEARQAVEAQEAASLLDPDWGLVAEEWTTEPARQLVADDGTERVVGLPEACAIFGWRREQVREWLRAGHLEAEMTVNRGPAWFMSTLREWWAGHRELDNAVGSAAARKAWETRRRQARGEL
jgi:ParB/RepB/Spo0J family partition protein